MKYFLLCIIILSIVDCSFSTGLNKRIDIHIQKQNLIKHLRKRNVEIQDAELNCNSYKIAFLVDTSASIFLPIFGGKTENIERVKNALSDSIQLMQGKPVSVSIFTVSNKGETITPKYAHLNKNDEYQNLENMISNIGFSDDVNSIMTNWEDGLLQVLDFDIETPDFLIFITDGDPTMKNDEHDESKTDMESALEQISKLVHSGTKVIPVGISDNVSEEHLRATTGMVTPQIGQDYFMNNDFNGLEHLIMNITRYETCCNQYKDECGVCFGNGTTCKDPKFHTWSKLFTDKYNRHEYNYHYDTIKDGDILHVHTRWDYTDKHFHYDHNMYHIEIDKVSICIPNDGELVPYNHEYPTRTGCRSPDVSVDICVLHNKEKINYGSCKNTKHEKSWHGEYELNMDKIFGFSWKRETEKDRFYFKARALTAYKQILQIHWKLVYSFHNDTEDHHQHYIQSKRFMEEIEIQSTNNNIIQHTTEQDNQSHDDDDDDGHSYHKGSHIGRHCKYFSVECPEDWQLFDYNDWICKYGDEIGKPPHGNATIKIFFVILCICSCILLVFCLFTILRYGTKRRVKCKTQRPIYKTKTHYRPTYRRSCPEETNIQLKVENDHGFSAITFGTVKEDRKEK